LGDRKCATKEEKEKEKEEDLFRGKTYPKNIHGVLGRLTFGDQPIAAEDEENWRPHG
jgi:hypothetical protein